MYDKTNQKALGKFKSEETFEITDLCGLKPTCYAYTRFVQEKNLKNTRRQKEC